MSLDNSNLTGGGADAASGFGGRLAIGHAYSPGWRTEIELGYRRNDIDKVGGTTVNGEASALSGMINGYYDIATNGPLAPYFGFGLGLARVSVDSPLPTLAPAQDGRLDDGDTVFAYQGILGVSYAVSDALALTADYRYFATQYPSFGTVAGAQVDGEYESHAMFVGLRFSFGGQTGNRNRKAGVTAVAVPSVADPAPDTAQDAPEPEQPVADATDVSVPVDEMDEEIATDSSMVPATNEVMTPEPALSDEPGSDEQAVATVVPTTVPPRTTYQVFFALGSHILSDAAQDVLRDVVGRALEGEPVRIVVTGYTDTSGPREYNMALSRVRAEAVRRMLVDMGIADGRIDARWRGEDDLLVKTANGIQEAKNRRVKIVFAE